MAKPSFSLRNIPGWAILLVVFGLLYFTGLHKEALGQAQRLLLATGIRQAEVPELIKSKGHEEDLIAAFPGEGFTMVDLQGKTVQFEELKGKVIFLNIWATWCPPCIAEMPNIQRLYEKVGSDKIAFVMLSVDQAGMEKVKGLLIAKALLFRFTCLQTPCRMSLTPSPFQLLS